MTIKLDDVRGIGKDLLERWEEVKRNGMSKLIVCATSADDDKYPTMGMSTIP